MADLAGEIFQHIEYFPFGETWVEEHSHTQRTPYLFTAKELDEETGLYYFGARYYDPRTSVWQSPDPILAQYMKGDPAGGIFSPSNLAMFAYSGHNPLNFKDYGGLYKEFHWKSSTEVVITVPVVYTDLSGGSAKATAAGIEKQTEANFSGTYTVNGKTVTVTTDVIMLSPADAKKRKGKFNTVTVDPSVNRSSAQLGGKKATLRTGASDTVGAHEIGHLLGATDQYEDDTTKPVIDPKTGMQKVSTTTGKPMFYSKPKAGQAGSIMSDYGRGANDTNMTEILTDPAEKVTTAPKVKAPKF